MLGPVCRALTLMAKLTVARNFADNIGMAFHTPEEFFLQEEPKPFKRDFEPRKHLDSTATTSTNSGRRIEVS